MYKKLFAVIIAILIFSDAYCLAPAGITHIKIPNARRWDFITPGIQKNPYRFESRVSRGINHSYSRDFKNDLFYEISKKSSELTGPVRILMIGVGRGFEAFELKHEFGAQVHITATNKDDLLIRDPQRLLDIFEKRKINITLKEAESYLEELRSSYFEYDIDNFNIYLGKYDFVIICSQVYMYVSNKYEALQNLVSFCEPGGFLYIQLQKMYVSTALKKLAASKYFEDYFGEEIAQSFFFDELKIINQGPLIWPELFFEHQHSDLCGEVMFFANFYIARESGFAGSYRQLYAIMSSH